jgi:DNA-directed RNA polymerase specialized sigma24 family protein
MSTLTATAFEQFLIRLDKDQALAAEKYETLRLKLIKAFIWKGCGESAADGLADAALDRVALKLSKGEQIQNLNAYALEVSRFVWLEFMRKRKESTTDDGNLPESAAAPEIEILNDPDLRLRCLRKCMAEVVSDERDRTLIIGYYDADAGEKNKDARKNLAEKLGLTMTTLKVKACRLRERLERCINECVARLEAGGGAVTKMPVSGTNNRGGAAH